MNTLVLPMPPSVNAAYNHRKDGKGRFKNPVTKRWEQEAQDLYKKQEFNHQSIPPYHVTYTLYFGRKGTNDIANREKVLSDFLTTNQIITDDGDIDHMEILRGGYDKDNPRVEIMIESYKRPRKNNKTTVLKAIKNNSMTVEQAMWLNKRLTRHPIVKPE
jgi:Holliday junction resolvase RusA-like endonuclease